MAVEVSNEFKRMCKTNVPSGAIGRITVLEEDPEDNVEITENTDIQSIEIEDNCYVNDKFIGTAVAKKVTVNLINEDNTYDLEDKEISVDLGFQQYDEDQEYEGKNITINNAKQVKPSISLEGETTQEVRESSRNIFNKNAEINESNNGGSKTTLNTGVRVIANSARSYNANIGVIIKIGELSELYGKTIRVKTLATPSASNLCASISILSYDNNYSSGLVIKNGTPLAAGQSGTIEISKTITQDNVSHPNLSLNILLTNNTTAAVGDYTDFENLMVTIDDEDMTYEPYGASPSPDNPSEINNITGDIDFEITNGDETESQEVTFPLGSQKLMQGSYLAGDGIHNVRKQVVFDGTENWSLYPDKVHTFRTALPKISDFGICTHYLPVSVANFDVDTGIYLSYSIIAIISDPRFSTVESFKSFLAGQYANDTPVTIEYVMRQDQETIPYTTEQQTAWNNLQNISLYSGTNHINSDAKANITIKSEEIISYGNFIIEKPNTEETQARTNFVGYDYMIKFNKEFVDNNTYPVALGTYFSNLCTQVGLIAGNTTFVNSDYMVKGNPFTNGEKCKEVLSAIAQIAGGIAKIGRDNKVYIINLSKEDNLEEIDGNNYDSFQPNNVFGPINKLILKMNDGVDGEESVRTDAESVAEYGECAIIISNNPILNDAEERELVIDDIFDAINGVTYLPFKTSYYGYPYADSTDKINILNTNDTENDSYIFNHRIKYDGAFEGSIETPALTKVQSAYTDTRDLKNWRRNTELKVDKINGTISSIISQEEGTQAQINSIMSDVNGTNQKIEQIENETNSRLDEIETSIDGISNQMVQRGGNNLFYYAKEFWKGQEVTTTTRRTIRVGDDLSGKKIYLSFPTENPVNVLDYNTGNVIEGENGSIYHYKREAYAEEFVSVEYGVNEDFLYEMQSFSYIDGVTEYTMPSNFGVVTQINDQSGVYQYIQIDVEETERILNIEEINGGEFTTNSVSGRGYIVNEGSSFQDTNDNDVSVPNGLYTVSFLYKKIGPDLASASVKINGIEYPLTETNWTSFSQTIDVTTNHLEVEFISDTDNTLYVADLLGNAGSEAEIWTQNPNETRTDTVKIGRGIEVSSSTQDTKLKADADGVRIVQATNEQNVVARFTKDGTETKELIVENKAQIAGVLIQQVGDQTWFSSLL